MKHFRLLPAVLAVTCLALTGCAGSGQNLSSTAASQSLAAKELSPAEISEQAMGNFLAKISKGNYTVNAENYLKTTVYSEDQVWFDFTEDDRYTDFAVMSVKDEVFQAMLEDGGMDEARYLGEGKAIEAASSRLPNYWLDESVSEGNIYNLFYNQQKEPLTFVSYNEIVKRSLLTFAGYGDTALRLMEEVYMEMDDVDPKVVHLKAVVNDDMAARISFDDIDVTVTFGDAAGNQYADAWMKDPKYPEAGTDWSDADEFVFNSVFVLTNGKEVIPFPPFASYALKTDDSRFLDDDAVYVRDAHASEKDVEDYIALLKQEGFEEAKETAEDGSEKTVYRRVLREAYHCYTQVEAEYNSGMDLTAKKYYECPEYDGLEGINERITSLGYTPLPESDNFISVKASDKADALTESWLYFFDYESNLYVDIIYQDHEALLEYLKEYEAELVNRGFRPHKSDEEQEEPDYYESENGFSSYRYHFDPESVNRVTLLYRAQRFINAEEAEQMIKQAGFPEIDLNATISSRDLTQFEKAQYNREPKMYLTVSQTYETVQEAEAVLNAYEEKLTAAGFERVNPDNVGSRKAIAIYNEAENLLVGIDFYEQNGGALVNFDFIAG